MPAMLKRMQHLKSAKQLAVLLSGGEPFLLKFTAPWCPPCREMVPVLERVLKSIPEVQGFEVDFDTFEDLAKTYKVMSLPTLLLFYKGAQLSSFVGADSEIEVRKWIQESLKETE